MDDWQIVFDGKIFLERIFSWQVIALLLIQVWGLNFHRRVMEIQRQNKEVIDLLKQLVAKLEKK